MATATSPPTASPKPARSTDVDQRVEFVGVGWDGYRALLRVQGERSRPQMVYLDGDVTLVSPSNLHECLKKRLGQFVVEVAVGLDLPFLMAGETTFRRRKKEAGVQPDESFYLANAERVADRIRKHDLDLQVDPPPDLAIEVVHTHDASAAVEVLRRLGVPEVWVGDEDGLRILLLQPDGQYAESATSRAFPILTADEIFDWANQLSTGFDSDWTKELRRWVQDVLVPRVRGRAD